MPVAVFSVGCAFGTDRFNANTMANMILVTIGVAIASYGAARPWLAAGALHKALRGAGGAPRGRSCRAAPLPSACAAPVPAPRLPDCRRPALPASHGPWTLAAGELNFNVTGVLFQLGSIFSESIRLVMVQILLQASRAAQPVCACLLAG